ncbi:MAG: TonB-dependent receptor [Bacteroidetes bacterium]|nr:TonB-dependent receptor [Bacteroidota bacterium]
MFYASSLSSEFRKKFCTFLRSPTALLSFFRQKSTHTVSGYVIEKATGESLLGANVYLKENLKGTTTNQYGFYSITVPDGDYTLVVAYLGFISQEVPITLKTVDITKSFSLESASIETKEVTINGEKEDRNVQSAEMGRQKLSVEKIKTLPAFLGEVDILKTIQLLPGVSSAGEGNSGFYVRGGGPDQNLILLDEANVYNAAHLFGFFSVFNADAVQNITLTKGNMPANYGGRLSSVLDIQMKEGNNQRFGVQGGIGFVSSRLTIEGPIKKDTSSFIVSARRTFIDLFMGKPFVSSSSNFNGNKYYFYDLNAKVNYRLSDKDRLFLSGYFGRDVFRFKSSNSDFTVNIPWGNATATARWNHLFHNQLFLNTSLIFTNYDFSFEGGQEEFSFKLFSGIKDYNVKTDFTWLPNTQHTVKFGMNYIYHVFIPNNASARSGDVNFNLGDIVRQYAHDGAVYLNDNFEINDKWLLDGGVRLTLFDQVGPFDRFVNDPITNTPTDTIHYDAGQSVKAYFHVEPRFAARYSINHVSSLKASYSQNYQYIHLASLSGISLPTDTWVPSSDRVKPQFGTQYALGYFRNLKMNMYETSVEVYYKEMKDQIEYQEGFLPENQVNGNLDNFFVFGKGWSYGAEFFFKKAKGDLTGWVGYTIAWTKRQFADLNLGNTFYPKYDRRHDISVVLTYDLNARWTFGATWVYATGNLNTFPERIYLMSNGDIVEDYGGQRNNYRLPAYHRMDVSATYKIKKHKRFESSWNFSIFNVYNRYNPYIIYFDTAYDPNGKITIQAKQISLFPLIPSVTYNFKF